MSAARRKPGRSPAARKRAAAKRAVAQRAATERQKLEHATKSVEGVSKEVFPAAGPAKAPLEPVEPPVRDEPTATEGTGTGEGSAASRAPRSWSRLGPGAQRLLTGTVAFLLGIGLVSQINLNDQRGLESLSQPELLQLLEDVTTRSDRLGTEIRDLEQDQRDLKAGSRDAGAATKAQERLDALRILAGTAKAHGPGVEVRIDDPDGHVRAADLIGLVAELRDAGAEAIQVAQVRVVASTWFEDRDGKVVADGHELPRQATVVAIGDPHTLARSLSIPGGAEQTLRESGARVTTHQLRDAQVEALRPPSEPRYARPVGSSSPSS